MERAFWHDLTRIAPKPFTVISYFVRFQLLQLERIYDACVLYPSTEVDRLRHTRRFGNCFQLPAEASVGCGCSADW
jgi:hypothetical protein